MQRWSVPCALKDKIHSHSLMHLVRSRGEDKIHRLILREKQSLEISDIAIQIPSIFADFQYLLPISCLWTHIHNTLIVC